MSVHTSLRKTQDPPRQAPLAPGAPRVPQVNLLPPEIRATRALRQVKRLLLLLLLLTVVVAGAGYAWAALQARDAQAELDAAQAETTRILKAQAQYAEVPQVMQQLEQTKTARALGTSSEVLWRDPLTSLVATAPAGVRFTDIQMTGATPMQAASLPENPLRTSSPAVLTFSGRAPVLPDTSAWIEALDAIPSFANAYVTSAAISSEDENGTETVFYEVTGSVQVTSDALANRYATEGDS